MRRRVKIESYWQLVCAVLRNVICASDSGCQSSDGYGNFETFCWVACGYGSSFFVALGLRLAAVSWRRRIRRVRNGCCNAIGRLMRANISLGLCIVFLTCTVGLLGAILTVRYGTSSASADQQWQARPRWMAKDRRRCRHRCEKRARTKKISRQAKVGIFLCRFFGVTVQLLACHCLCLCSTLVLCFMAGVGMLYILSVALRFGVLLYDDCSELGRHCSRDDHCPVHHARSLRGGGNDKNAVVLGGSPSSSSTSGHTTNCAGEYADVLCTNIDSWDRRPALDPDTTVHHLDSLWYGLQTCGDGACALHAVWGVPIDRGHVVELYKANVRQHVLAAVPTVWEEALQWGGGVLASEIRTVVSGLWSDLLDVRETSAEKRLFAAAIPGSLREEVHTHQAIDMQWQREQSRLSTQLDEFLQKFFKHENESALVRPLSQMLGYLDSVDVNVLDLDVNAATTLTFEGSNDGGFQILHEAGEGKTKYQALFRPLVRPASTNFRTNFRRTFFHVSNDAAGRERCDLILLIFTMWASQDFRSTLSASQGEVVNLGLQVLEAWYNHSQRRPPEPEFENAVGWAAFLQVLRHESYWLSSEEVRLLGAFWYLRVHAHTSYGIGLPLEFPNAVGDIHVQLRLRGESRRGHFVRVLRADDYEQLSQRLSANPGHDVEDNRSSSVSLRSSPPIRGSSASSSGDEASSHACLSECSQEQHGENNKGDVTGLDTLLDVVTEADAGSDEEAVQDQNGGGATTTDPVPDEADVDDFSDVSDNSDLFHVEVDPEREFITAEDQDLEHIRTLAQHLRPYPLLPPDGSKPGDSFMNVDSGARLPTCHCAFHGCTAFTNRCFDEQHWGMEKWLFDHLLEVHAHAEMKEIFAQCCDTPLDKKEMTLLAYYTAAVAEREREHVPLIGPSVDRRSLAFLNQLCRSRNVDSQICFVCAQIHTHVACWDRLWHEPGKRGTQSVGGNRQELNKFFNDWRAQPENYYRNQCQGHITSYKIRQSLFQPLVAKSWQSETDADGARDCYNKNLLKAEFIDRFANPANETGHPWHNASELRDGDWEWQRKLVVDGSLRGQELPQRIDNILCCPEDAQPCQKCKGKVGTLCGDCSISLCHRCGPSFMQKPDIIAMGLCNDNLWGYTSDLIYKYQVRWLEAAIVTPCWTSFLVFYVEADGGHLLNEDLHDPKYRTRVRGSAISYMMPWEDILKELRENYLDRDFLDLPRRAEHLKYIMRVHLNVAGQNMEKHIKQLRVRPFVLLLLLEFLIDRRHEVFKGKGSPEELKRKMREIVAREYPEREGHIDLDQRAGEVPQGILETMREMEENQRCAAAAGKTWCKRERLFRDKNATPGDKGDVVNECLGDVRPMAMCVDRSTHSISTPAATREGAFSGFGHLAVQTGNKYMSQWCPQYFSQILPFVIPRMVSGPDFRQEDAQPWRRQRYSDAPRVHPMRFCAGFARRAEACCRTDWSALPIFRSVAHKYMAENISSLVGTFVGKRGYTAETDASDFVQVFGMETQANICIMHITFFVLVAVHVKISAFMLASDFLLGSSFAAAVSLVYHVNLFLQCLEQAMILTLLCSLLPPTGRAKFIPTFASRLYGPRHAPRSHWWRYIEIAACSRTHRIGTTTCLGAALHGTTFTRYSTGPAIDGPFSLRRTGGVR